MESEVRVGPLRAAAGSKITGLAHIGELADGITAVEVPVYVVNGAADGPLVYLQGGAHGQETPYAVEMMRRLMSDLNPLGLRGAVVAVPVANILAHQSATRVAPHYAAREGVSFSGDLHKLWPGDRGGSLTQRIVHFLWSEIISQADCAIDFHAVVEPAIPFSFLYCGGHRKAEGTHAWKRTLNMARAFGLTIITTAPNPLCLAGACLDAGKPAFMVEMLKGRSLDEKVIRATHQGTRNVLSHLGMLDAAVEQQSDFPVLPDLHSALPTIRANRGGFISFEVECGVFVSAGHVIARIRDLFGRELEAITMPRDGYVMTFPALSWVGNQAVATGDLVADIFE